MEKLRLNIRHQNIIVKIAETEDEIAQAQQLRYEQFVLDYNENTTIKNDVSDYDDRCDILVALDADTGKVVGTYRLMRKEHSLGGIPFICEDEFDITPLKAQQDEILELGRAVVHHDYRNGLGIKALWKGIFEYCSYYNVRYLFGTASYRGNNIDDYKLSLAYLYHNYLADESVQCSALQPNADINFFAADEIDRSVAKVQTPSLISAYLLMGSKIAKQAYIDSYYNTIDVLTILDLQNCNTRYIQRLTNF